MTTKLLTETEYEKQCRDLFESHFEVVLTIKEPFVEKIVEHAKEIVDPITRNKVGSPRQLLQIAHVRGAQGSTCDPNLDKKAYLVEIKNLYDNKQYPFSFTRATEQKSFFRRPAFILEKAPYQKPIDPTFRFSLTLLWKVC